MQYCLWNWKTVKVSAMTLWTSFKSLQEEQSLGLWVTWRSMIFDLQYPLSYFGDNTPLFSWATTLSYSLCSSLGEPEVKHMTHIWPITAQNFSSSSSFLYGWAGHPVGSISESRNYWEGSLSCWTEILLGMKSESTAKMEESWAFFFFLIRKSLCLTWNGHE